MTDRLALTVKETCRQLSIGRTCAYDLIRRGLLESVTIGRRRLVLAASLHRLIQKGDGDA